MIAAYKPCQSVLSEGWWMLGVILLSLTKPCELLYSAGDLRYSASYKTGLQIGSKLLRTTDRIRQTFSALG